MNPTTSKRTYHPLIILLYVSGMLDENQKRQLPRTTRWNWNKFEHDDYYGVEWARSYIDRFDEVKEVFASSFLYKALRFMIKTKNGYDQILQNVSKNKKFLKSNTKSIVKSIDHIISFTKVNVPTACRYYGISKDWYYTEKRKIKCGLSPFNICYRQQPNQLTSKETTIIEKVISNPENYGKAKTTLYYKALRGKALCCAKSTFFKYAKALGYTKPKRFPKPKKKGFRASRVFEWLHVDITYVPTLDDGIQKVAFVKDNFSKALLHYSSTSGKAGGGFIASLFQKAFERHQLFGANKPIKILSDGGPENKGLFLEWIDRVKAPPVVDKLTARTPAFPFSNSMAESTHSIFKTEFLKGRISKDKATHLKDLKRFFEYYNNERYPTELYGLAPTEVLKGKLPNKNHFSQAITEAGKKRLEENRAFNACVQAKGNKKFKNHRVCG